MITVPAAGRVDVIGIKEELVGLAAELEGNDVEYAGTELLAFTVGFGIDVAPIGTKTHEYAGVSVTVTVFVLKI